VKALKPSRLDAKLTQDDLIRLWALPPYVRPSTLFPLCVLLSAQTEKGLGTRLFPVKFGQTLVYSA